MEAFIVLGFYALIGLAVVVFGGLVYVRATMSRKTYRCQECNEVISVELMDASYCNVCGAPLRQRKRYLDYDD
ncbi:MAG: hypothetical protein ACFCD0_08590 [Gemmataceae bacterium]